MERLKYFSSSTVESLRESIVTNVDRYRRGDFLDFFEDKEWSIELDLEVDLTPLLTLDPSGRPEDEIRNSMLVWQVLKGLSPALAYEEGIWTRLTHVECLQFCRDRWLSEQDSNEHVEKMTRLHFFANTLTRRRDDNAISRLWWNGFIAHEVMPENMIAALEIILMRADMRSNIVERSRTGSRIPITAGIIRAVQSLPWVTASERNFRSFMSMLNRIGGGVVFEAMEDAAINSFMKNCAHRAGMPE